MAETQKQDAPKNAPPAYILAGEQQQRQALAEEMRIRNADPLDESKREGGFYLRDDGTPVDAEGVEIEASELEADEKAAVDEHKQALGLKQPRRAAPKKAKR